MTRATNALVVLTAAATAHSVRADAIPFVEHELDLASDGVAAVFVADLNGDGHADVLAASVNDDTVAWYENDGATPPGFTKHVIDAAADGASSVTAADLDGDGDLDVAATATNDDAVWWYENGGGANPVFTARWVAAGGDRPVSVDAADVDGDGDVDLLTAWTDDDRISVHLNSGGSPPAFAELIVDHFAEGAKDVTAADVDGDGHLDLVSAASYFWDEVSWYRNDGANPPSFDKRLISSATFGALAVFPADLDGDGDVDVLTASSFDDSVRWFESDGGTDPAFTEHVVTASADFARSVFAADLDHDGVVDVLSASSADDSVRWFENDGAAVPGFVEHGISAAQSGAVAVFAADLDGDGDRDVVAAAGVADSIRWYENPLAVDEEEPDEDDCPSDQNDDGFVGFQDLIALLGQWGPCEGCSGDLDGDGNVGAFDLVMLVQGWGACPGASPVMKPGHGCRGGGHALSKRHHKKSKKDRRHGPSHRSGRRR